MLIRGELPTVSVAVYKRALAELAHTIAGPKVVCSVCQSLVVVIGLVGSRYEGLSSGGIVDTRWRTHAHKNLNNWPLGWELHFGNNYHPTEVVQAAGGSRADWLLPSNSDSGRL